MLRQLIDDYVVDDNTGDVQALFVCLRRVEHVTIGPASTEHICGVVGCNRAPMWSSLLFWPFPDERGRTVDEVRAVVLG